MNLNTIYLLHLHPAHQLQIKTVRPPKTSNKDQGGVDLFTRENHSQIHTIQTSLGLLYDLRSLLICKGARGAPDINLQGNVIFVGKILELNRVNLQDYISHKIVYT